MIITRVMYWRPWRVPKYVMYSHIFGASWPRKFSQIKEDSDAFLKSFGTSDSALRKLLAHAGFQRQAAWLCRIYDLCVLYQNYIIYRWTCILNIHIVGICWNMLEYVGICWNPFKLGSSCVGRFHDLVAFLAAAGEPLRWQNLPSLSGTSIDKILKSDWED